MARWRESPEGKKTMVPPKRMEQPWGNQVRTYVLDPYTMAKDLRTGLQTGEVFRVLDGDLDTFLKASLAREATKG